MGYTNKIRSKTMNIRQRLANWLAPADVLPENVPAGSTNSAREGIIDGVDYSQPISLAEHIRKPLEDAGKLTEYLQEVSQSETMRFQFDSPYRNGSDLPINPTTEDPLREWNAATRQMVLANCHSAYQRNPLANTAVQYTADFVIGEGFNLTCRNKKVQKFLEDFIKHPDNAIREYERQAVIDLQVDGELFIRYFTGSGAMTQGQVVAVPLRPWECMGIQTELGFFRRAELYHFQMQQSTGDDWGTRYETVNIQIPADEVQHVAINRHGYELRGRPELYRVLPWLRADSEFLQNRARQNHWRNALLWWVSVTTNSASQLAQIAARWARPPTPGSVVVESDKVKVSPLTNSSGGAEADHDGRAIKLRSIIGFRLPEYFFADGFNANLASSKSQSLPAMTKFSAFQTIMVEQVWTPMFKRVLETAIEAGLLAEEVQEQDSEGELIFLKDGDFDEDGLPVTGKQPKMCDTVDVFDVSYAPLADEGMKDLAEALALIKANGWIDDQSAQEDLGLDPAIIAKRLKRQQENERDAVAQGNGARTPGEMVPQMKIKSPDLAYAPAPVDENGIQSAAPAGQPVAKQPAAA